MPDDVRVIFRSGRHWGLLLTGVAIALGGLLAGVRASGVTETLGAVAVLGLGWWLARAGVRRDELRIEGGDLVIVHRVATVGFVHRMALADLTSAHAVDGSITLQQRDGRSRTLPVAFGSGAEAIVSEIRQAISSHPPVPGDPG